MYKKAFVWPLCALLIVLPTRPCPAPEAHDTHPRAVPASTGTRHGDCIRPAYRGNRLYRRPNGTLALWNADAMWQRTLPPLPAGAMARPDGLIVHNGELHVTWRTGKGTGIVRVAKDGADYRLQVDGGPGPRIARGAGNNWALSNDEGNYAQGSVLAGVVSNQLTADPGTLQRAAHILGLMGLPESQLHGSQPWSAGSSRLRLVKPLALVAIGQAFVETLPARLRDPLARDWTLRESKLVAADLAAYIQRPLAIYYPDNRLVFAVDGHGRFLDHRTLPAETLRLVRHGEGTLAVQGAPGHVRYPSVFSATEAGTRSAFDFRSRDTLTRENEFRAGLAAHIEGASSRPRLERVIEQWIDTLGPKSTGSGGISSLVEVARLRQALFDRHHALTATEEHALLEATRAMLPDGHTMAIHVVERHTGRQLAAVEPPAARSRITIEADVDGTGRRIAYFQGAAPGRSAIPSRPTPGDAFSPLVDVLLNTDDGTIRRALSIGEWDFRGFADRLVARIAADENAHLPPILDRFISRDPEVLRDASQRTTDDWWMDGRHFVRLRNLDGTTQIVETDPLPVDGGYNLPGYGDGRGSHISRLTLRNGKWYPSRLIRSGFGPTSDALREQVVGMLGNALPPGSPIGRELLKRAVDATPYPLLLAAMATVTTAELTPAGEVVLAMGSPILSRYPTGVHRFAIAGEATVTTAERPATPLSMYRERIAHEPALHGATPYVPPAAAPAAFESLMQSGAPVGDFIQRQLGNRQIQALATARRLRTMLRSDEYIVVVGTTAGHSLTLALPVNAASIHLLRSGQATISSLPEGTRIIDDWLDIAAMSTDYPSRVRARAAELESFSFTITLRKDDALSTVSPVQFADRVLNGPVMFNPWNPSRDPISEERYFNYVLRRYDQNLPATPAGLDWLETHAERAEMARYFVAPSTGQAGVSSVQALARSALQLSRQDPAGVRDE